MLVPSDTCMWILINSPGRTNAPPLLRIVTDTFSDCESEHDETGSVMAVIARSELRLWSPVIEILSRPAPMPHW